LQYVAYSTTVAHSVALMLAVATVNRCKSQVINLVGRVVIRYQQCGQKLASCSR
jgi:hypothetical protein